MKTNGSFPALSADDLRERSAFRKQMLRLAAPVALQGLISAAVNYADVLMLSAVNQDALSAVSQAGQVTFVLTLVYMGLSMGVSILTAQYWGKGDRNVISKVLGLATRISVLVSVVFFLLAELLPRQLMRIYTPDGALLDYGAAYLRVVAVSYLAMSLSQPMLASVKSTEQTKACSFISAGCLLANIALNALAVFVLFPNDPMGAVTGVAGATVISRILETAACFFWVQTKGHAEWKPGYVLRTEKWLKRDFRKCSFAAQLNYLIWGGAITATSALVGHVSTDMVSAFSVAGSVRNLAIVACDGLSAAGGILIGKYLGAKRISLAIWSLILGALAGAVVLAITPLCLKMVSLTDEASAILKTMLLICSYYCIGKSFNATMVCGVFCAGGDTRFGLICDTFSMWGVILPLACLCAFALKLSPGWIFFVLCLDEFIKMPFMVLHYRKYKWLNNLTRTEEETA